MTELISGCVEEHAAPDQVRRRDMTELSRGVSKNEEWQVTHG